MKTNYIEYSYAPLIDRCIQNIVPDDSQPKSIIIYGGRGLGKTPVLEIIKTRLKKEKDKISMIVDGKSFPANEKGESLEKRIKNHKDDEGQTVHVDVVLLDDIDDFVLGGLTQRTARFQAVNDRIEVIRRLVFNENTEVVGTSVFDLTELPDELDDKSLPVTEKENRREIWTNWIYQFGFFEQLNPWEGDWRARLTEAVRDLICEIETNHPDSGGWIRTLHNSSWLRALETVTGGHPALVKVAFDFLFNADKSTQTKIKKIESCDNASQVLFDAILRADDRFAGIRHIRRSLQILLAREGKNGEEAFRELQNAANNEDSVDWTGINAHTKRVANEYGLLRKDTNDLHQRWEIPGTAIKEVIRDIQSAESSAMQAIESGDTSRNRTVTVEAIDDEKEVGQIIITGDQKPQSIKITGLQWKLIKGLAEKQGKIVAYSELSNTEEDIKKMRNAKDVLVRKLNNKNIPQVVESVYGEGLRLRNTV